MKLSNKELLKKLVSKTNNNQISAESLRKLEEIKTKSTVTKRQ